MRTQDLFALIDAVRRQWKTGVTGSALLVGFGMVERLIGGQFNRTYLWLSGPAFLVFACSKAWLEEHTKRVQLEDKLRPQLALEADAPRKPYVETFEPTSGNPGSRVLRVGVRNLSGTTVEGVRVALENCWPDEPGIHHEHYLQAMARDLGEEQHTVAPGERGFFDVVMELSPSPTAPSELAICYAKRVRNELSGTGPWLLRLRVEGAGAPTTYRIVLVRRDDTGRASLGLAG